MEFASKIIFWLCLGSVVYTYLLYPLLLRWLGRGRSIAPPVPGEAAGWPRISVLMSVYNEERVIRRKLESLVEVDYPKDKLAAFIGSDCSNDGTDAIVGDFASRYPFIHFYPFEKRQGKPGVVNQLARLATARWPAEPGHLFLMTDASVMLDSLVLQKLARHFGDPRVGLADTRLVHTGMQEAGISRAENQYISSEVRLKYLEGLVWGRTIGPFGACYAVRSNRFSEVPPAYLVDDFYIAMKVLEQGDKALLDLEALCFEPVSHEIGEEYRRKARISAGNFQNLLTFSHLWWPPFRALNFAFFSHKVLRWMAPFAIILMLLCAGLLALQGNLIFLPVFWVLVGGLVLAPLLDKLLKKWDINILPLRGAHYFIMMNLALLEGFFKFIKGIRSNVWEPTKRN